MTSLKIAPKPVNTGGTQPGNLAADRQKLSNALKALVHTNPGHPLLQKLGKDIGVGLGVLVTEGLAASKKWNAPLKDANGQPVKSIRGAERQGDYDIRKRHEIVVGDQINAKVATMDAGAVRDFLKGLGAGATEAPGDSYRLEAKAHELKEKAQGWIKPR